MAILILMCLGWLSISINAQEIRLGPQLGFTKTADADQGNLLAGAALRLKLSSSLGLEGSIHYRQEKFAGDAITVRSWPVMVTGLIYPLPMAYGAVGAGWYNSSLNYSEELDGPKPENTREQQFGWHFGGGLELPIGGATKLTADMRYTFLNYNFDAIPGSDNLKSDFFTINAGLLFKL